MAFTTIPSDVLLASRYKTIIEELETAIDERYAVLPAGSFDITTSGIQLRTLGAVIIGMRTAIEALIADTDTANGFIRSSTGDTGETYTNFAQVLSDAGHGGGWRTISGLRLVGANFQAGLTQVQDVLEELTIYRFTRLPDTFGWAGSGGKDGPGEVDAETAWDSAKSATPDTNDDWPTLVGGLTENTIGWSMRLIGGASYFGDIVDDRNFHIDLSSDAAATFGAMVKATFESYIVSVDRSISVTLNVGSETVSVGSTGNTFINFGAPAFGSDNTIAFSFSTAEPADMPFNTGEPGKISLTLEKQTSPSTYALAGPYLIADITTALTYG